MPSEKRLSRLVRRVLSRHGGRPGEAVRLYIATSRYFLKKRLGAENAKKVVPLLRVFTRLLHARQTPVPINTAIQIYQAVIREAPWFVSITPPKRKKKTAKLASEWLAVLGRLSAQKSRGITHVVILPQQADLMDALLEARLSVLLGEKHLDALLRLQERVARVASENESARRDSWNRRN